MKANLFFIALAVGYIIFTFVFLYRIEKRSEKKPDPPVINSQALKNGKE